MIGLQKRNNKEASVNKVEVALELNKLIMTKRRKWKKEKENKCEEINNLSKITVKKVMC
jgi:hypothetical protein